MSRNYLAATHGFAAAVAVALLAPAGAGAQAYKAPRTVDGQPDLQGVWDFRTITPMERPASLGNKEFFANDEEVAAWERAEKYRLDQDKIDPETGGLTKQNVGGGGVGVAPYNEFWFDRGDKVVGTRRTSLIVDPPDGRLPAMTPEGQKRADARAQDRLDTNLGHPHADSWEDRPLQERCLVGLNAGPPMTPGAYNNNVQVFQTPDYVAILTEMVHDARIVPLDGRPHGNVRRWNGNSRAHWEGDTLVVDTINFKRETSLPNSSANLHLVERFTRTGPDTLEYRFTVEDPSMWTRPWTAIVPMKKSSDPIYEYACHEGNYAMASILAGARLAEKTAAEAAKTGAK